MIFFIPKATFPILLTSLLTLSRKNKDLHKNKSKIEMKKIILSIALVAIAASSAMAQVGVGVGYLSSTATSKISDSSSSTTSNGFYAGGDYDVNVAKNLYIAPGLYYGFTQYKTEGSVGSLASATSTTTDQYLAVPVNVKYSYPVASNIKLFAYAGPRLDFGLSSKTKVTASALGVSGEETVDNYGDDSNYNRVDLSLGCGCGVELFDMVRVSVGYNFGFLDLNKSDNITTKKNSLNVGAAFIF